MATPFDPKPVNNAQSKIDQANVQLALAWLVPIDALANKRISLANAYLELVQEMTLPIDTNTQTKVAAVKYANQDILVAAGGACTSGGPPEIAVGGYQAVVTSWGQSIQSNRVRAADPANANNPDVQSKIIFPLPPESLTAYAEANGLPPLEIIGK